jgi:hypothetical protein
MFLYCSVMPARWTSDRPMSRQEFEVRFPDDAACARHLVERRRPDGFVCPVCDSRKGWPLNRERPAWECAGCRRQTSVTAGTVMHRSHLPLRTWFLAAHIVASHSNGISALQLQGRGARHITAARGSRIDDPSTRHPDYAFSLRSRKRIQEGFDRTKEVFGLAQVKLRGLARVDFAFVLGLAGCNLVRLPTLLAEASP